MVPRASRTPKCCCKTSRSECCFYTTSFQMSSFVTERKHPCGHKCHDISMVSHDIVYMCWLCHARVDDAIRHAQQLQQHRSTSLLSPHVVKAVDYRAPAAVPHKRHTMSAADTHMATTPTAPATPALTPYSDASSMTMTTDSSGGGSSDATQRDTRRHSVEYVSATPSTQTPSTHTAAGAALTTSSSSASRDGSRAPEVHPAVRCMYYSQPSFVSPPYAVTVLPSVWCHWMDTCACRAWTAAEASRNDSRAVDKASVEHERGLICAHSHRAY